MSGWHDGRWDVEEELAQHRENLRTLELQAAHFGIRVPLDLANEIKAERLAIERIEQELAKRGNTDVAVEDDGMADMVVNSGLNNARLERLFEIVHEMEKKQAVMARDVEQMQEQLARLVNDVHVLMAPTPMFSREWLVIGGLVTMVVLGFLLWIAVQVTT